MLPEHFQFISEIIGSETYANQARQSHVHRNKLFKDLLSHRRIPKEPWLEGDIEWVIGEITKMDSNNFDGSAGLGEREARIINPLVARRHYKLGHGIGRSGDILEVQPKAAGSSLIQKLTNYLALDAIRLAGATKQAASSAMVLPMATGMSLTLCLITLKRDRPDAKYVIWPRIDQKSCFKAIITAGLEPIVIPNIIEKDQIRTNVPLIRKTIQELGANSIVCVFSTTSCFAPRVLDMLTPIALLCRTFDIPHLINNAYGVQSSRCMNAISDACLHGRVDLYVQSTDKNFLVPVGGAIVCAPDSARKVLDKVGKMYPGRASISPILDVFITLLGLGANGYVALLNERKEMYQYLHEQLQQIAEDFGTRVLRTPLNDISIGISLAAFDNTYQMSSSDITGPTHSKPKKPITFLGSMLFSRSISGTRVVPTTNSTVVANHTFQGFMSHIDLYQPVGETHPVAYLTCAAAIGVTRKEIDVFLGKLRKVLTEFVKVTR